MRDRMSSMEVAMRRFLWLILLPGLLEAQNISSSLSGTVQDPTGAVVAAARVTLTSEDTGFIRTVTTTHGGFFSFPDLTPATFSLEVTAPGFKTYRQTGIDIGSSAQHSAGAIRLQLGEVSDAVTVTADAATVNTISGEKSSSLNSRDLEGLALRGRDLFDALSLMPGIVDATDGRDAPSTTSSRNIYIAGGRNESKSVTIDGVYSITVQDPLNGKAAFPGNLAIDGRERQAAAGP
jgi:hypothetical protein